MDKWAHWSHCWKNKAKQNRTIQAWMIQSYKELDGYGYIWNLRTSGHTAQLWGGGEESKFRNIFLSLTSSKQMAMVPAKSLRCDEKFWSSNVRKYLPLPLYFHPSNLSSTSSLLAVFLAVTLMKAEAAVAGASLHYILHQPCAWCYELKQHPVMGGCNLGCISWL